MKISKKKQEEILNFCCANFAIENMDLTPADLQRMKRVLQGKTTAEKEIAQIIQKIKK